MRKHLFILSFILISTVCFSQTTFYNVDTIQKIEISFTQPDWDYQLDTAKYGTGGYIMAQWVKVNGVLFDSVGVRYKGNSSYDSTYLKNPIHISLNQYKNNQYQGVTNIKLSNGFSDPSLIREVLSYDILQNYMDCPRANFAQLYINGAYIGVYTNDESIDNNFLSEKFYSNNNVLIKCNPTVNPSVSTKCNLRYQTGLDSTGYFNYYDLKSNYGWNELVALCDTVTNYPSSIGSSMDMDRGMWMISFDNSLVNLDSYFGAFCQNYYLYKDNTLRFNPIVWDLNMSFGGFPFLGSGGFSLASLTVANMQQLSPTFHSTDVYWPVIKDVMNNPMYKRMYIAHERTILNEMFVSNYYQTRAAHLQSVIDTAALSDANNFYSYAQFQTGMTTNTVVGSYTVPGITNLMSSRVTYLQSTAEFTATPPVITAITPSNAAPSLNLPVTITAHVSNANTVMLGYRFVNTDKFVRDTMYDDGLHNDGAAGDSVYGTTVNMSSVRMQYYIYAENATAGIFSPERAEHEFYELLANAVAPTTGQIVINEFLAFNLSGHLNEFGYPEDWIELYNTTSNPLSLFGLFLSDNYSNPTKYAFPETVVIPANGYLIVWADQNMTTTSNVHCNFKLSINGERIMLSDVAGNVLDSISYGVQTADISMGRCPNGTGSFGVLLSPSYAASNCTLGIHEYDDAHTSFHTFPNPANTIVNVTMTSPEKENNVKLFNTLGQSVYTKTFSGGTTSLDISSVPAGVYYINVNCKDNKRIEVIK